MHFKKNKLKCVKFVTSQRTVKDFIFKERLYWPLQFKKESSLKSTSKVMLVYTLKTKVR